MTTATLLDYVLAHTVRGECGCGRCIDRGTAPDPPGHTVDLVFFKVAAAQDPDVAAFRRLTQAHRGHYGDVDPFDGMEHTYIELGAWIGDQGGALQYMGLGALLGVFTLLTPDLIPGLPSEVRLELAARGMVVVQARGEGSQPPSPR